MSALEDMTKTTGKQGGISRLFGNKSQAESWLENRIRRGKVEKFAEIIQLTPEIAQALLDRNPDNRPISQKTVQGLSMDIETGRWKPNGESIIVSKCGHLNDGQHRCHSVVHTGKPVEVLITFGWPRDTRDTIDTGLVKTVGHHLGMEGFKDSNHLATAARLLWQYENAGTLNERGAMLRPTKAMIKDYAERHPGLIESLNVVPTKTNGISTKSRLAFCHYLFAQRYRPEADFFIQSLIEGEGLIKGDPILVARNRILSDRAAGKNRPHEQIEVIFRAWNFFRSGEHIRRINTSGRLPKVQ